MPIEGEPRSISPEYDRLQQLLTSQGQVEGETEWWKQLIIGKETKFGRVDVQPMGDHIEVQVFSPDQVYTNFEVFEDQVEAKAGKGPFGESEVMVELPYTLEQILAEL